MATIQVLPIEQLPELMQTMQTMMDVNPDGGQLDNAGVKLCLSQIAKALHSTVLSIVTMKSSVITETGTADTAFKKLEMSFAALCAKTEEMNARLPLQECPQTPGHLQRSLLSCVRPRQLPT